MGGTIWTIGHSTHTLDAFTALLRHHGIEGVVDVRAFPGSRRHPHFARERLAESLPAQGLRYDWLGQELGGRRRPTDRPSPNTALRNESFRNYADFMATPLFSRGVDELLRLASQRRTAFFCAELLWWRCHRSLIADYLTAVRGWTVLHILDLAEPKAHKPKSEARVEGSALVYAEPDLF